MQKAINEIQCSYDRPGNAGKRKRSGKKKESPELTFFETLVHNFHKAGYKPWEIEKLYDYSIDIASQILESWREDKQAQLVSEAYYSFTQSRVMMENKGFSFDDFADLLGEGFMDKVKQEKLESTLEARNRAYEEWQKRQKPS